MEGQVILNGVEVSAFIEKMREVFHDEFKNLVPNGVEKPKSDLMTIDELCSEYRFNKQTVYTKASKGKIPHFKVGKPLLFSRRRINEWLKEHQKEVSGHQNT